MGKISNQPDAGDLVLTDMVPIVHLSGTEPVNQKTTMGAIKDYVIDAFGSSGAIRCPSLKIGMLGDSVTMGRIGGGDGAVTPLGIPYWVNYELRVPVTNYGVGGIGWMTHKILEQNAYEYMQTIDLTEFDVLTLDYGLNDTDVPLGDYLDTTEETIFGYIFRCLNYIYSVNPTAKVIMINPTVGQRPDVFPYYDPTIPQSEETWTFSQFFEQMNQFCNKYALPLIDSWKAFNAWNRVTFLPDKLHPSVDGYKVLGTYIAGHIRSMI